MSWLALLPEVEACVCVDGHPVPIPRTVVGEPLQVWVTEEPTRDNVALLKFGDQPARIARHTAIPAVGGWIVVVWPADPEPVEYTVRVGGEGHRAGLYTERPFQGNGPDGRPWTLSTEWTIDPRYRVVYEDPAERAFCSGRDPHAATVVFDATVSFLPVAVWKSDGPVDFSAPPVDLRYTPDGHLWLGSTSICPDPSFDLRPGSAFHVGFRLLLPDGSFGPPTEVAVVLPPGRP